MLTFLNKDISEISFDWTSVRHFSEMQLHRGELLSPREHEITEQPCFPSIISLTNKVI